LNIFLSVPLDITQPKLAEAAGLGLSTIVDFEKSRREVSRAAVHAMQEALEKVGIQFIAKNGGGPGVRLRQWAATGARSSERETAGRGALRIPSSSRAPTTRELFRASIRQMLDHGYFILSIWRNAAAGWRCQ
jgi:hypothetical protein